MGLFKNKKHTINIVKNKTVECTLICVKGNMLQDTYTCCMATNILSVYKISNSQETEIFNKYLCLRVFPKPMFGRLIFQIKR